VKRLFAGHHRENAAARRLLEKLGFRFSHEEFDPPTGLLHPSYLRTAAK
jgi:[ribosomal protein S5]-alanine N-acetyltransferase